MAPISFLDVAYGADAAGVACVLAESWQAQVPLGHLARRIAHVPAPYQPGEFYKRELPLLLDLLRDLRPPPGIIVVDGYVWLGEGVPGLGARLFTALGGGQPVVGVAKSPYRGDTAAAQVLRGGSRRPLHVTAAGVALADAAAWVRGMHGAHRIPTLLKEVDRLSRKALAGGT
jgi:deoxyribonuclease V